MQRAPCVGIIDTHYAIRIMLFGAHGVLNPEGQVSMMKLTPALVVVGCTAILLSCASQSSGPSSATRERMTRTWLIGEWSGSSIAPDLKMQVIKIVFCRGRFMLWNVPPRRRIAWECTR